MKKLKLLPKIFLYTLALMVFIVVVGHILIYLLAPQMGVVITVVNPATNTAEVIEASRDRESGGNGLGLYIVDALLDSMNIPYSFAPMKNPPGMCFTIQL